MRLSACGDPRTTYRRQSSHSATWVSGTSGLVAGAFMAEPSHSLPTSLLFFRRPVCEFLLQRASVPLTSLNQSQGGGDIHWASALMRLRLIGALEVGLDLTDMVSQTQG